MPENTAGLVRQYGAEVQACLKRQWPAFVTCNDPVVVEDNPDNGGHYATLGNVLDSDLEISLWVDKTLDGKNLTVWLGFGAEKFRTIEKLLQLTGRPISKAYSRSDIKPHKGLYYYGSQVRDLIINEPIIENFQSEGQCSYGIYFDLSAFKTGYKAFLNGILTSLKSKGSKYHAIRSLLSLSTRKTVEISLERIAQLIGKLPKDAATPQFWANTNYHSSRRGNWLDAGFKAYYRPQRPSVQFVASGEPDVYEQAFKLLGKGRIVKPNGTLPVRVKREIETFARDLKVVAYVLQRAEGKCECCEKDAPFKRPGNGQPFLEVHHIDLLADGGKDSAENAIAVCPNCHRFLHFGEVSEEHLTKLKSAASA